MIAPTGGFVIGGAVLLVLAALGFGAFFWRAWRLYQYMRLGRDEARIDHPWRRVRDELVVYLGQRKLLKRPYYVRGLAHAFIFWGFLVITIGTVDLLVSGIVGFHLPGTGSGLFAWTIDIFAVLVLASIAVALVRRLFFAPPRMHVALDGYVILGMIAVLMLTLLVFEGAGLSAGLLEKGYTSPPIANAILRSIFSRNVAGIVFPVAWWMHVVTVLAFAAYLPQSKHLHIVTTLPNVFFRKQTPRGQLSLIKDIENQETFGAATVRDFSWKQLLDGYTCTECGRCSDNCPALATGKPLDPQKIVLDIRDQLLAEGPALLKDAKAETKPPAHWVESKPEELWACTTCAACVEACPVTIEHIDKIVDMRRHLTLMEGSAPPEAQRAMTNIERAGNPWGEPRETRGDWAKDLGVPTFAEKPDAEYLYFVGCAASVDRRNQKVARSLVQVLRAAGVSFAILASEETCNGDPARRIGNEYLWQTQAQQNIDTFKKYGVRKIIASCPHCFNTLANEYGDFGGDYEVVHHTELLAELVDSGRLQPKADATPITYHDSCYLARHNDVLIQPRKLVEAVGQPIEMKRSGKKTFCCGAGGAHMWMEETGTPINAERVREAIDTGAETLAVACPFCTVMLDDGVRETGAEIRVADVATLLAESMGS